MKRNQLKVVFVSLLMFTFLLIGCSKNNDDEPIDTSIVTISTLNGFDFSGEGTSDGYLIKSQPNNGSSSTYPNNDNYIWWIPYHDLDNMTKDMGLVTLESVTQAPTDWEVAPNITPLLVNHVYVVRLIGINPIGYAKFKVISIDLSSVELDYKAKVKYVFSETSNFSE